MLRGRGGSPGGDSPGLPFVSIYPAATTSRIPASRSGCVGSGERASPRLKKREDGGDLWIEAP